MGMSQNDHDLGRHGWETNRHWTFWIDSYNDTEEGEQGMDGEGKVTSVSASYLEFSGIDRCKPAYRDLFGIVTSQLLQSVREC